MSILKSIAMASTLALGLAIVPALGNAAYGCGSQQICLYKDSGYGSSFYTATATNSSPTLINYIINFGVSSWRNESGHDARWFPNWNGDGTAHCMNSYSASSYVGWLDNDALQSMIIYTDGYACS